MQNLWNSLESVSRWSFWTNSFVALFGVAAAILGVAALLLGRRKDELSEIATNEANSARDRVIAETKFETAKANEQAQIAHERSIELENSNLILKKEVLTLQKESDELKKSDMELKGKTRSTTSLPDGRVIAGGTLQGDAVVLIEKIPMLDSFANQKRYQDAFLLAKEIVEIFEASLAKIQAQAQVTILGRTYNPVDIYSVCALAASHAAESQKVLEWVRRGFECENTVYLRDDRLESKHSRHALPLYALEIIENSRLGNYAQAQKLLKDLDSESEVTGGSPPIPLKPLVLKLLEEWNFRVPNP